MQINNSASSLSTGTLHETGRWRTNHIKGLLKAVYGFRRGHSSAMGLITLNVKYRSLIKAE